MKTTILRAALLGACLIATAAQAQGGKFTLSSPDIPAGGKVPMKHVLNGFGCSGQNVAPALEWHNAPAGTKSFSITVYDPDAPTGSGFWHWSVHNLPGDTTKLAQGAGNALASMPAGTNPAITDFQDTGATGGNGNWGGPCPPVGDKPHRYVFTVYALDVPDLYAAAGIPKTGTAAVHGFALNKGLGAHVLGKASFTAKFGR